MIIAPKYSNCLIWACCHWVKRGGYVSWRWSHHIKYLPHFLWSPDLKIWYSYEPIHTHPGWHLHFLLFHGHVVENYKINTDLTDA